MADHNRTCIVCGATYTFCPHCGDESRREETWRMIYCSNDCRQIFGIVTDYLNKHIDLREARHRLGFVSLKNQDSFDEDIRKSIEEILTAKEDAARESSAGNTPTAQSHPPDPNPGNSTPGQRNDQNQRNAPSGHAKTDYFKNMNHRSK